MMETQNDLEFEEFYNAEILTCEECNLRFEVRPDIYDQILADIEDFGDPLICPTCEDPEGDTFS